MGRQDPIDCKAGAALSACLLAHASWSFAAAHGPEYGIGAYPTPALVEAWDLSIPPDGEGLRKGNGTVAEGRVRSCRLPARNERDHRRDSRTERLDTARRAHAEPRPLRPGFGDGSAHGTVARG